MDRMAPKEYEELGGETLTRKSGGWLTCKQRKSREHYGVTNKGRKLVIVSCRNPRKGDIYLKPSGERGVYYVWVAKQDFPKNHYLICREKK